MRCANCGTENRDGAKFCSRCGGPLPSRRGGGHRWRVAAASAGIVLLAGAIAVALIAVLPKALEPKYGPRITSDGSYVFDETILETIPVSEADGLSSVEALEEELRGRGFEEFGVTAPYGLSGELLDDPSDVGVDDTYPLYVVDYVAGGGERWTILVCDGAYMANPVFMYGSHWPQVLLVEDDCVTSYDSSTDMFYRSVPGERELDVRKVGRIDAETIEALDAEGVEAL